ncbi:MAG: histidine phosphatase family protein [Acidobacteriota bacterium]
MATRIFLIRHGTALGAENRAVGQVDLPLSPRGADDLSRLAASWDGPPPDVLFASDLERAWASANVLSEAWEQPVRQDQRLREISFGVWDGRPWDHIERQDGARFRGWMARWWQDTVPGGESFDGVAARANEWLDQMLDDYRDGTVAAVAHGGSIRGILGRVLGMPTEKAFNLYLDHGRVSCVATGRHGLEVVLTNGDRFPP